MKRRDFLAAVGAVASTLLPRQVAAVPEPQACVEPLLPYARRGHLVACAEDPGYYTVGGVPALFIGDGWFSPERWRDPAPGTTVIEVDHAGAGRCAVVR